MAETSEVKVLDGMADDRREDTGLNILNYMNVPVRTYIKENSIYWILKDVCDILGLEQHRRVEDRLDDDEKSTARIETPGGSQEMIIINESGLYSVILRSDKPEAKRFKKWVTAEVLPSIRRTGGYTVGQGTGAALSEMGMAAVVEAAKIAAVKAVQETVNKINFEFSNFANNLGEEIIKEAAKKVLPDIMTDAAAFEVLRTVQKLQEIAEDKLTGETDENGGE